MTDVEVRPVTGREEKVFLHLQEQLYAGDPHFVPPLWLAEKDRLDAKKNPFLARVAHQRMLAWRDGLPVGRIMTIDDPRHNETHGDNLAFFGFFEAADQEVTDALLHAAEEWARGVGCKTLQLGVRPSRPPSVEAVVALGWHVEKTEVTKDL